MFNTTLERKEKNEFFFLKESLRFVFILQNCLTISMSVVVISVASSRVSFPALPLLGHTGTRVQVVTTRIVVLISVLFSGDRDLEQLSPPGKCE